MGEVSLHSVPSAAMDALSAAAQWHDAGLGVVIATVVATSGSAPRPAGAQMAMNSRGGFVGSVSAGCVESAVLDASTSVLATGTPLLLRFGVSDDAVWAIGLSCGGVIEIYLELVS